MAKGEDGNNTGENNGQVQLLLPGLAHPGVRPPVVSVGCQDRQSNKTQIREDLSGQKPPHHKETDVFQMDSTPYSDEDFGVEKCESPKGKENRENETSPVRVKSANKSFILTSFWWTLK